MSYSATKPKVSAKTADEFAGGKKRRKEAKEDSEYFEVKRMFALSDQKRRKQEHVWKGFISPSSQIHPRMCLESYFARCHKFVEFEEKTLHAVNEGTKCHAGEEEEDIRIPGFLYPRPDWAALGRPDLVEWQATEAVEWVFSDVITRMKVDRVLDIDGEPVVADLKNTRRKPGNEFHEKEWLKILKGTNKSTYEGQVLFYINRLNAHQAFGPGVFCKRGKLLYRNRTLNPYEPDEWAENDVDYWSQREMCNIWVEALYAGLLRKRNGKPVYCHYAYCPNHGDR